MNPTFLHVDMDAFFASVEQIDHPEWRGKPVIVGAAPNQRGVVAAASYEARAFGVRSAMPSCEAGRLCPRGIFTPPRGARYREISEQVLDILSRFTPFVEPLSIDEAFLEVAGARRLHGEPATIARAIKQAIVHETGLTASVGAATNKFLAKLASELKKPDGLTVLPSGDLEIQAFLAPMPVDRLWGVGRITCNILKEAGWHTIGDLQRASLAQLGARLGNHAARHIQQLAAGRDDRGIELARMEKSISREYTFPKDCPDRKTVAIALGDLADDVAARVRHAGFYACTAHIKLRWHGFETITRQKQFPRPCCDNFSFRDAASALFQAEQTFKPVRLAGFGAGNFQREPAIQLELFDENSKRVDARERISRSMDAIKKQFGQGSIRRAISAKKPAWNNNDHEHD